MEYDFIINFLMVYMYARIIMLLHSSKTKIDDKVPLVSKKPVKDPMYSGL